jgi:hypothetical protein
MDEHLRRLIHGLKARRTGAGWIARCPAHEDKTPSLSIREGRTREVVLHCHAGCPQDAVIEALRARGLWPEREPERNGQPYADPEWAEDAKLRVPFWRRACIVMCDDALVDLCGRWETADDPTERMILAEAVKPLTELRALCWSQSSDWSLVSRYREMRAANPDLAAGLVYAGQRSRVRVEDRLARFILRESEK